jgi:hypothetical protein
MKTKHKRNCTLAQPRQNLSPLMQLLEQIAEQHYESKALADNQVEVQHKTSDS